MSYYLPPLEKVLSNNKLVSLIINRVYVLKQRKVSEISASRF